MRKLSIRLRLLIVMLAVLILMAGVLTVTSIYDSSSIYGELFTAQEAEAIADEWEEYDDTDEAAVSMVVEADRQFRWQSILWMTGVILIGGIGAWFILGAALRPVKRLTRKIEGIQANQLYTRIDDFQAGDELDRLADAFNHMMNRLEEAFQAQKQFSTAAAHELKTPLSAIKTNLDVLKIGDTGTREEYERTFRAVERQTNRMIQLVDDLFLVSDHNDYALGDRISLGDMLADIVREQQNDAAPLMLHAGKPVTIHGNAAMLHRALSNLVENAVKYNKPEGNVEIRWEQQGIWAVVTVTDTGKGIAPEHLSHIFEPFYRVDVSRSRKTAGSGLGLSIVKDTVTRHGGKIAVSSVFGEGSRFCVKLPVLQD